MIVTHHVYNNNSCFRPHSRVFSTMWDLLFYTKETLLSLPILVDKNINFKEALLPKLQMAPSRTVPGIPSLFHPSAVAIYSYAGQRQGAALA